MNTKITPTIGIIGYGKFTELMLTIFKKHTPDTPVKVSSRSKPIDNKTIFPFEEVAQCDFVIPSVPIAYFEDTIKKLIPYLKPGSTVIDICSVKMHPKYIMLQYIPEHNYIVCTHPNFGPESYRLNGNSTRGLNFIIEYVRIPDTIKENLQKFLQKLEVHICTMNAEQHDKEIGVPHFVSLFTGMLIGKLGLTRTSFGAASTQRMFDMVEGVGKDSGILHDMYHLNPYCKEYLDQILTHTQGIHSNLKKV